MAVSVDFGKLRDLSFALTHDWALVIDEKALDTIMQGHPIWGTKGPAQVVSAGKQLVTAIATKGNSLLEDKGEGVAQLFCKSSTIPKSTVRTQQVKVYGIPTTVVLEDNVSGTITLTFLEDENHVLYKFFTTWKDLGASRKTYATGFRGPLNKTAGSSIDVKLYLSPEQKKKSKMCFTLIGAQPIDVELSPTSSEIGFMKLNVTLKYDNFEVQ